MILYQRLLMYLLGTPRQTIHWMVSTSSYDGKNPRKFLQFLTWRNTRRYV